MTLADFARSIRLKPSTARQWRKRGKIIELPDGGFALRAGVNAQAENSSGAAPRVIGRSPAGNRRLPDAEAAGPGLIYNGRLAQTETECAGCAALQKDIAALQRCIDGLRDHCSATELITQRLRVELDALGYAHRLDNEAMRAAIEQIESTASVTPALAIARAIRPAAKVPGQQWINPRQADWE